MFSGIVDSLGKIARIAPSEKQPGKGCMLAIQSRYRQLLLGESVCVEGVCLTVTKKSLNKQGALFNARVSEETLRKTTLGQASSGQLVNLERSLKISSRISGHIVQGHVDATGAIVSVRTEGYSRVYTFSHPSFLSPFIVNKGSVCVDGISLTVVETSDEQFTVSILPYTEAHTSLHSKQPGSAVNLEADILCKIVAKQVRELFSGMQESAEPRESAMKWQQIMREEGYL